MSTVNATCESLYTLLQGSMPCGPSCHAAQVLSLVSLTHPFCWPAMMFQPSQARLIQNERHQELKGKVIGCFEAD